jgi:hypothetical protein
MKTRELTGAALDWAVAKCEGHLEPMRELRGKMIPRVVLDPEWYGYDNKPMLRFNPAPDVYYRPDYAPSTDWETGGPIIEREAITVSEGSFVRGLEWMACDRGSSCIQHGPTYLIAAMRCYVASKLGDEVEIPKELT